MRLTTVLLLASLLQVSAATFGQRITLTKRNVPLMSVLKEIRSQSGFNIFFENETISNNQKVSIDVKEVTVNQALEIAFRGLDLTFEIDGKAIAIKKKENESYIENVVARFQAVDVKGKVLDSLGNGIGGATITVKGTKTGTTSSASGDFYLKNVDESAKLSVSFLGYITKEVAINREFTFVRLEQSTSKLDEIQIQAYGVTSRRLSTGSISTVKAADIERQPVNNPLLALQGRIAGMTIQQESGLPGATPKIQIRGRNSINGSNPLYVIDGLPVDPNVQGGPLSLPGAQDNNGTVQTSISLFSLLNPQDIESIDVLKDADATSIYGSRGANGVILITTKKGSIGDTKVDGSFSSGAAVVGRKIDLLNTRQYLDMRYAAYRNDGIPLPTVPAFNNYDLTVYDTTRYTDWQKELIGGTAKLTNARMSVQGGTSTLQYIISGGFQKETTVSPGDFYNTKGNVHLGLTNYSNNKRLRTDLNVTYLIDNNTLPGLDFTREALLLSPNSPALFDSNGSLNWQTLSNGRSSWRNPLARMFNTYQMKNANLVSNANISYQLWEDASIKLTGGYNVVQGNSFTANTFAALPPENWSNNSRNAERVTTDATSWIFEPQVTYNKYFGIGKLSALLGATLQQNKNNLYRNVGTGFPDDESVENFGAASDVNSSNSNSIYKYSALFGRIGYNIQDKYILNFNVRRDGSSRFGPGSRFGSFGSIGAAWIFSEEKWLKDSQIFTYGKLRVSYGTSGNDQIPDYRFMKLFTYGFNTYQGIKGLNIEGLYDSYFQWEVTRKAEIGLELGLFSDKLVLDINYYRNRSGNQLVDVSLPAFVGPGAVKINRNALVQNSGLEFSVISNNITSKTFSWTTSGNIAMNRNKLLAYPDIESSGNDYLLDVGQPLTRARLFDFNGVNTETGIYEFNASSGAKTSNPGELDRTKYITLLPKFFGGIQNTFTYKGFSLDFFLQFTKQEGRQYEAFNRPGWFFSGLYGNQPTTALNNWTKEGDNARIQKFSQNSSLSEATDAYNNSNAQYGDASYIRLKNVSLVYDFRKIISSKSLKNIKLVISGQNLLTITNYKGLDPEAQGIGSLPPLKVWTAGIQLGL